MLIPLPLLSSRLAREVSPLWSLLAKASEVQSKEVTAQQGAELPGFWPGELSALDPLLPMLAVLSYILAAQLMPWASLV